MGVQVGMSSRSAAATARCGRVCSTRSRRAPSRSSIRTRKLTFGRQRLPSHVSFHSIVDTAERAVIPDADVIVSSLTLHHVAGVDIAQRRAFGLDGDGKSEILRRCLAAIRQRRGVGILNEADCYNEIELAPSDPVLVDRFLDAYVRRCARAVVHALDETDVDSTKRQAWTLILKHWCLDQTQLAFVPREQRDVYELDAAHSLGLLADIGTEQRDASIHRRLLPVCAVCLSVSGSPQIPR